MLMSKVHYNDLDLLEHKTACGLEIGFDIDHGGYFKVRLEYTDKPEEVTCENCKRTNKFKDDS